MHRVKYLLFFFLIIHYGSFGQILDDSTKQVYGPKSTEYILEADVFKNKKVKYNPDTLINQFFRTDAVSKNGWMFQDLGNNGTASKSILFKPSDHIYTETGFSVFDLYSPKTRDIKYYNTKSPYTNMGYTQGFKGYSNLLFTHSQNVTDRLNFTLDVDRLNSSKQFQANTSEDKLVDHWNYALSSNYTDKKEKYSLLAVFYHLNHLQHEQGGLINGDSLMNNPGAIETNYNLSYQARLNGVNSSERWNNLHIYHQYKQASGFQIFHVFDMERKKHFYNDANLQSNFISGVYPDTTSLADTVSQNIFYRAFGNKFGFKGRLKGFDYQAYISHRLYDLNTNFGNPFGKKLTSEFFAGVQAAYYLNDSTRYLLAETEFSQKLNFKINGELHWDNFIVGINSARLPPGLIYEQFYSNVYQWDNDLANPFYLHLRGEYTLNLNRISIRPSFKYTSLANYLYFDQQARPAQTGLGTGINFIDAGLEFAYSGRIFSLTNQSFLNLKISDKNNVLRIPMLMNNTNIMFKILYAKTLKIHTGLDIYYKSAYYADAYMPLTQQFYLQDKYELWNYAIVEPFLAFNIKRVKLAFKYGNAGHSILRNGYFTSPYYLGMRSAFYLKVEWPLFD